MFDYVIFDTPPVSLFVDAPILSSMTDGTLFVTRQNQTKRSLAVKSVQQLRVANARILGIVTTFCTDDESQYYYAYYTQEGKRANKKETAKPAAVALASTISPADSANPYTPNAYKDLSLNLQGTQRHRHRR
jgi:Mrp family chromosome partitioning ATPase